MTQFKQHKQAMKVKWSECKVQWKQKDDNCPPNELVRMSTLLQDQNVNIGSNLLNRAVLTGQRSMYLSVFFIFSV